MNLFPAVALLFFQTLGNVDLPPESIITANDLHPGKIVQMEEYPGRSLSGYIDGGAELFHEYGFDRLLVYHVAVADIDFVIEAYLMEDPLAAFGVFSVSSVPCSQRDSLVTFSCITPFQVQGASGRLYFRVQNARGSETDQEYAVHVARILSQKERQELKNFPRYLNDTVFAPFRHDLRFARGPLGIQNGYPDLLEQLDGLGYYSVSILPIESEGSEFVAISIRFGAAAGADSLLSRTGGAPSEATNLQGPALKKRHYVWRLSPGELVLAETTMNGEKVNEFLMAIRKAYKDAKEEKWQ